MKLGSSCKGLGGGGGGGGGGGEAAYNYVVKVEGRAFGIHKENLA